MIRGTTQPRAEEAAEGTLATADFERVARLLYAVSRIRLQKGKEQLVRARLWKRVRASGLPTFERYLDLVESQAGRKELAVMVDALTTNKTSFFRESQHFDFLRRQLPSLVQGQTRLRIWCAGCSTGQEPYSLAMTLLEARVPRQVPDTAILATDISFRVLEEARSGIYDLADVEEIERPLRLRYFTRRTDEGSESWQVAEPVRALIRFARLNLMEDWPMSGPFDAIFCRNVMIYFDKPTQTDLVERFRLLLRPGGYLFVGHSESLAGRAEGFAYVQPAVYRRTTDDGRIEG